MKSLFNPLAVGRWPKISKSLAPVKSFLKKNQQNKLVFLSRKNFPSVRFDKELQESKNNKISTALISNCEVSHG